MDKYRIGIDLGGTKIEAVLLGSDEREIFRKRVATPGAYEKILNSIHGLILDAVGHISGNGEYCVGVGIPGSIHKTTGLVHNANTTCLIGKPFKEDIQRRIGRMISMENDANCFTLIEALRGAGKKYRIVFGVIMGTGCGGGISVDGKIVAGRQAIAGEWGHFAMDPKGIKCYCGNRGCVETKISGSGVEKAFQRKFNRPLEMDEIVKGYRKNDPQCRIIFEQFLDDFGRALGGLISILDPDAIVLGGGLSNIDELYDKGVELVSKYVFHDEMTTPILKNSLGDSSGVLGAAFL
jgi:fructokinase